MNLFEAGEKAREIRVSLATAKMRAFGLLRRTRLGFGLPTSTAVLGTHAYSGGSHFFTVDRSELYEVDLVLRSVEYTRIRYVGVGR